MISDGDVRRDAATPQSGRGAAVRTSDNTVKINGVVLRDALRTRLTQPLPGLDAHRRAWPEHLPRSSRSGLGIALVPAAVLIALHPADSVCLEQNEGWCSNARTAASVRPMRFPLIQRADDLARHPGQVAFPGGTVEEGESIPEAAMREASEEIGLDPAVVEPLGCLTPVDVEVTGFRIHPVVGWLEQPPAGWELKTDEAAAVYSADPDLLILGGLSETVRRSRGGIDMDVPAYRIPHGDGAVCVWGATAIILSEFLEIWAQSR